jgi:UDP-N-acetylglucosamine 4-epimerase
MKNGKSPTINGDGDYSRDFTYIDNVIQANILALTTQNKESFGEAFNIGVEGQITIYELFKIIKDELKLEMEPVFGPNSSGDIPHSNADISKARTILNYNPQILFKEGIIKTIKYYNI